MDADELRALLRAVREGRTTEDEAVERLRRLPTDVVGNARLDTHRQIRTGIAEVVYAPGKEDEHLAEIVDRLVEIHGRALVTRLDAHRAGALLAGHPDGVYSRQGRTLSVRRRLPDPPGEGRIAVVTAGTADVPVAEEAACTLEHLGWPADRIYDVGVAGLHRVLDCTDRIDGARAAIVVAGMEGALPTVVAGLTFRPVIAVPTSVGYGANFSGISALLTMLNTCSGGIAVVNIDNGFGAACFAHRVCAAPPGACGR